MKTHETKSILDAGACMKWLCESHVHAAFGLNLRVLTGEKPICPKLAQSFTQFIHMITLWSLMLVSEFS